MERLFPTGNQTIDLRIRYANEPGFEACILLSQSINGPGFEKRKYAPKPGSVQKSCGP